LGEAEDLGVVRVAGALMAIVLVARVILVVGDGDFAASGDAGDIVDV